MKRKIEFDEEFLEDHKEEIDELNRSFDELMKDKSIRKLLKKHKRREKIEKILVFLFR